MADVPPVRRFEVKGLSDLVVIAGPNGVGKTRLVSSLLAHLRNPGKQQVSFEIEATDDTERNAWGKTLLNTSNADDAKKMRGMLQQNRSRRNYKNSVLYYESNRAIQNVNPLTFQWEFADPYEEQIGWDLSFGGLAGRWQDTQHSIFLGGQLKTGNLSTGQNRQFPERPRPVSSTSFPHRYANRSAL